MARINSYPSDTTPEGSDLILGNGANSGVTKTFTLDNVAKWISETGGVTVLGQNNFKLYASIAASPNGALWIPTGDTAFNAVLELLVSKTDVRAKYIGDYLLSLRDKTMLLQQIDNKNNFATYFIANVEQSPDYPDFLTFALSFIGGNGSFEVDASYGMALESGTAGDDAPKDLISLVSQDGSVFDIVVSNSGVLVVIPDGSTEPVITSPPVIIGTEKVWYTLGAIAGGVTGSPVPERTWQWQRSTNGLTWADIPGADAATYTLVSADAGNYIRVQQIETNVLDAAIANSAATGLIADSVFSTTTYANITPITWENITQTWN